MIPGENVADQDDFEVVRVKVDANLKTAFVAACKSEDISPSQVLRRFMREYLRQHPQADLLDPPKRGRK